MQPQNRSSCQKKIDEEEKLIYTIYIPGQKKVEVARGVIELGQILIETYEGMTRPEFLKWLKDSRVGFGEKTAYKYMKIGRELEDFSHREKINELSLRVLYTLASAPEEVKEDVANSKDKEEDY